MIAPCWGYIVLITTKLRSHTVCGLSVLLQKMNLCPKKIPKNTVFASHQFLGIFLLHKKYCKIKTFCRKEHVQFSARVPTYALKNGKRGWAGNNTFLLYRHTILPGLLIKKSREYTARGAILQFRQRPPHQADYFLISFKSRDTHIL